MNIKQIRIANTLLTGIMVFTGHPVYLWYSIAMHISLEVLNHYPLYLQYQFKLYNFIFWMYELVLLERLRTCFFREQTERILNCTEHLLFGIIICIKIYIYIAMFCNKGSRSRWRRGLAAFFVFNIIGVVNEIFQNNLASRNLFAFIPDSIKDMQMNLLGACVFALAVLCRIWWLQRNRIAVL